MLGLMARVQSNLFADSKMRLVLFQCPYHQTYLLQFIFSFFLQSLQISCIHSVIIPGYYVKDFY
ncbi:Uncharacterised protein [Legionella feeleii]|uniref:Uncharacterized protein n=1 Tax=Legionella feeleii TaxID=453 RepID=A0A378IS96_9GAMM|nr:Uncharacterised protein [Legionella feeleii]